ncbi:unnamed protein product [Arctia plantaginis]|uniref:Major facilitator superfamily (MFS) profile domain-containing protein n=1 Tax=Arctia plantaginis TaxID=874455 RepID=A0A8S1A7H4_ARCPL|nr:unnamed protein product [Arctia plantaginis]CAB3240555.1 unnamed protein product [Arctia plantaginis]
MSFNKNNPNAMGKIMGYLKQISTEMGSEPSRRGQGDEERLYKTRGPKYTRVPSKSTLSASTTSTSLATTCGSQGVLVPNYATIPEQASTESSSEDEQDSFENTRRHFQQLRQISLGNEFKYKMEMEIKNDKEDNLKNSSPFIKQLSLDSNKVTQDFAINGDAPPYMPTTQRLYLWTQLLAAFAVSICSMIVGFSSAYTSPALASMNGTIYGNPISNEEITWIGGLMPLAALVGGVAGGPLIDCLGRRWTIMAMAIPFFLGWILIGAATNVLMVFAGRVFCGVCVGIVSLGFPVYLGETLQPEVRGAFGLLPTAFGNTGILLAFFVGSYLDWSKLAFFGAAIPVPYFLLMLLTPETPRWLVSKGRPDDARKALQWLRGKNANVEKELKDLTRTQDDADKQGGNAFKQLFSPKYMPAVFISLGLMLFQQLSGINAVIFYAASIFKMAGSSVDENLCSIIIGIVNFISTFIATVIIDRLGRKVLLYISSIAMICTLVTLGAYFYMMDSGADISNYGWLPLACLVIYVLGFSIGFGPIPWLMLGEILPSKIRGTAAALGTGFNWTCTFIVTKTFHNIIYAINMSGAMWLFAVICIIGLFFVIYCVPETRGKSLEDIERKLTGGSRKVRTISSKQVQNIC